MRCERHGLTPVIINDLDIVRIALPEGETDTPARVHRHRPLSCSVPFEFVKPNALEGTEVLQKSWRRSGLTAGPLPRRNPSREIGLVFRLPTLYGLRRYATTGSWHKRTTGNVIVQDR